MTLNEYLKKLKRSKENNKMFGEVKEDNKEFLPLTEGIYNVTLDDVSLDETGNSPFITATFTVLSGKYKNRKLWKRYYFSDGTARKFLPWQFGVLGIKKDLDECDLNSHQETARKSLDLLGGVIGSAFVADVSVVDGNDGKQYNDLVLTGEFVPQASDASDLDNIPNEVPSFDSDEEFKF